MRTFAYTTSSEQLKDGLRYDKRVILSLAIALCAWTTASAQQVAVKSNLFYWMTTTINAGAEVALSKHSTLGATFNLNPWTIGADNKIQHWFVRPEYRYWVTENTRACSSACT